MRRRRSGRMRQLLLPDPSPTAATSSTAAPATSSAALGRARNHGFINLQILQLGEQMQHPLEASPISSNPRCPNNSFLVENLHSIHHLGCHRLHKMYNQKTVFRLLFQQRTIAPMLMLTAVKRHLGPRILSSWDEFFTQRVDATGRDSHSPLQKCTAAIRMLGYGTPADALDEVLKIAASTSLECLGKFAKGIIECFGAEYLRPPTSDELETILQENESRGFPGMIGSIDCMHWPWKNCPKGWTDMFTNGFKGKPTIILEAVASRNLRIWHVFFGNAESQNDIQVLNKSPLFIEAIKGEAPQVSYTVNGTQYDTGYYLADGIYPEWAAFVKTVRKPQTEKHKLYAQRQEGARKDVECAFGLLQSRFDIVNRPARLWKRKDVVNIMEACVILHNMIVEDEKDLVRIPLDLNENPSATIVLPPEVQTNDNPNPCFVHVLNRNSKIRAASTHRQLKNDLVEHIWHRYGPRGG